MLTRLIPIPMMASSTLRHPHGVIHTAQGLDYFPPTTSGEVRQEIMTTFIRDVRKALDATGTKLALGLRLTPTWATLRSQGLGDLVSVHVHIPIT